METSTDFVKLIVEAVIAIAAVFAAWQARRAKVVSDDTKRDTVALRSQLADLEPKMPKK